MSLPTDQRAALAHQLLLSLDPPVDEETTSAIDAAWVKEARERQQAIRAGAPIRDWQEALASVRDSLKHSHRS
jgi:hypothetical protein